MRTRNALMLVIATAVTAAVAGAQQPKSTTPARSTATPQAPTAAKQSTKTAAAAALPISSDSAKKIVVANAAGATVSSARLHRSAGKAYYAVSYKVKGERKTMHATVDANTGAFAMVAPPAAPAKSSAPKKPS